MRSSTAVCRTYFAWLRMCWIGILRHIRTIRLWRGEFGATPPFDIGPDALIVGYALWAEMTCFLQLGWRFPVHVYDLHTAYLSVSNISLS